MSDDNKEQETATPADTQSEDQTAETEGKEAETSQKDAKQQQESSTAAGTEKPEEWDKLSGSTQKRVKNLLRRAKEAEEKLTSQAQADQQAVSSTGNVPGAQPSYSQQQGDDEVSQAMKTLVDRGIATQEQVEKIVKEELGNALGRLRTDSTHEQLEQRYDGSDGLPKYDREEVEDYARETRNYDLEAAFRNLYWDEFMDQAAKSKGRTGSQAGSSEKPTASQGQDVMTLEKFREKLRGPKGREYQAKMMRDNPEMFKKLLDQLTGSA